MSTSHHQALQKIDINPKYVFHKKAHLSCPYFSFSWHLQKQQLKIQTCQSVKLLVSRAIKNSFCQKLSKKQNYNKRNKAIRQKIIWLLFSRALATCTYIVRKLASLAKKNLNHFSKIQRAFFQSLFMAF